MTGEELNFLIQKLRVSLSTHLPLRGIISDPYEPPALVVNR